MELKDFIEHFAEQFEDTDSAQITADTEFHELDEWSSLIALAIIAMAKTIYGKTITGKEIKGCVTVENLFNLISSK